MALMDRTAKPPVGVPLRTDGHWSINGLAGAWPFNESSGGISDAAGGNYSVSSTGSIVHTADGITTAAPDSYFTTASPLLNPPGDNWTVFVKANKAGSAAQYLLFPSSGAPNSDAGLYLRDGVYLAWITSNYSNIYWSSAAARAQAGLHTWCITRNGPGLTHRAYRDGSDLGTAEATGATTNIWTNFKAIGTNYAGYGSEIQAALFYNRTLTDTEVAALSANPWQIFQQIDDGGGGTTFSQALAGAYPAPAGTVPRSGSYGEAVAGGFPAPTGGSAQRTGKRVAGSLPAATGGTIKRAVRRLAGTLPPPDGAPVHAAILRTSAGGVMGTISGAVAVVLNPVVAAVRRVLKIMGAGFKKIIGG